MIKIPKEKEYLDDALKRANLTVQRIEDELKEAIGWQNHIREKRLRYLNGWRAANHE